MTRIGFIGVGTMGLPMAKNLVKKGFAVNAFDTSSEAVAAAVAAGMTAAASAAETVATADLVITMLPSSPHVESVYTGDGGVLAAAREGTLCVDMSTIDPAVSRRVAAAARERGVRFIDAPVSGGVPRAIDGTLAIMVGGAAEDVKEALPALSAMGANVIHVGPVGSGEVVKLCNNLIAGVAAVAVSEAFRIAEGFGVDPKVVTEVISKSSGHTFLMEHMHPVPGMVERSASSQRLPGRLHDRPDVQGSRPRRRRGARAADSGVHRAGRAAGVSPRVVARPRAQGLHERVHVAQAVVGSGAGMTLEGASTAPSEPPPTPVAPASRRSNGAPPPRASPSVAPHRRSTFAVVAHRSDYLRHARRRGCADRRVASRGSVEYAGSRSSLALCLVVVVLSARSWALPEIVRRVAVGQLTALTGRQTSIERVELNLFTGRFAVDRLRVARRPAVPAMPSWSSTGSPAAWRSPPCSASTLPRRS